MEPSVLDDIREIEKLHRKLQVSGSPYDARKRYAECLRAGLAAWNEGRSCIYTDDVKAAEAFRRDGTWSVRLEKYYRHVMGDQGYGLFCEDGGPKGCDLIDFWEQVDQKLLHDVAAEALLVAAICFSGLDGVTMEMKMRVEALCEGRTCEAFCEASSNAREQVEKEAAALPATPPPVTDAPLPDPAPPTAKSGRPADPDREKYFKMMARKMWNGLRNKTEFCDGFLDEYPGAKELFKSDANNLRTQFLNWLKKKP